MHPFGKLSTLVSALDATRIVVTKREQSQCLYGANACFALATGFALGAAVTVRVARLRDANGVLALACLAAAGAMRVLARGAEDPLARDAPIATEASESGIDYSIIVPVRNRPKHITALLAAVAAQSGSWSDLGRGEILVVDDGSTDDTRAVAEVLAKTVPIETRVITVPHGGPGAARNAGFATARGRIGISIDSDCVPKSNWLSGLVEAVSAEENVVAFARIGPPDKIAFPLENAPDRKGFVTASFAMDREAFCALGGFHARYGLSHEDLDFVRVAKRAGFIIRRAESDIDHPIRHETPASIWRAGLSGKYGNLLARRHGRDASGITRTTPYFFFGVAGNYGSSIAFLVAASNAVLAAGLSVCVASFAKGELPKVGRLFAALAGAYVLALGALGLRVGSGLKRLPRYLVTLASFQTATMVGRLIGSYEYGLLLL